MKSIVLCGGGTAGHVMPNIALLKYLKSHYEKIYYIGSINGIERTILKDYPEIEYYPITSVKLIRGLNLKNLAIPFKLIKGYCQSKKILSKIKPNIIFSKGGYVSVPVTYAGKSLGIPIVAHESDYNLGLANKLILKKCNKMCCSFEETAKSCGKKGVFTCSPIRDSLFTGDKERARKICKFNNNLLTILIIGGSLGAQAINECMFSLAKEITKKYNIIHIVGKGNYNKQIKINNYYQIEFTNNIEDYFDLADMVISRAGSNAINEFLVLNKPMLLIPLPKGNSRGDQILNAQDFLAKGYANVLLQEDMNKKSMMEAIQQLKLDSTKIKKAQYPQKGKNGTKNILKVILENSKNDEK